jgi:hypothetical protein
MGLSAMAAGYSPGFELSGGEGLFLNHHAGDIKLFRYWTSHKDSLDHSVNISRQRLKSSCYLVVPGPHRFIFGIF